MDEALLPVRDLAPGGISTEAGREVSTEHGVNQAGFLVILARPFILPRLQVEERQIPLGGGVLRVKTNRFLVGPHGLVAVAFRKLSDSQKVICDRGTIPQLDGLLKSR